jgi:hypothetical protein
MNLKWIVDRWGARMWTGLNCLEIVPTVSLVLTAFKFHTSLHSIGNTRNSWGFGLCLQFDVLKNTMFGKLDLFPSSGQSVGTSARTLLDPLGRGKFNHWTTYVSITLEVCVRVCVCVCVCVHIWEQNFSRGGNREFIHSLTELSLSQEAAICAATQELPSILWNP